MAESLVVAARRHRAAYGHRALQHAHVDPQHPGGAEYRGARRRALFALSVAPVWTLSAVVFLASALYALLVRVLGAVWLSRRVAMTIQDKGPAAEPQFEEEPSDRIVSLDVWDHRFPPAITPRTDRMGS